MMIIKPQDVTPATLTSSNVPEDEFPAWVAGTYNQGDKRIYLNRIYEVLATTTTDIPTDGLAKDPPTWLDAGATNRWRMFDESVGSLTEQTGSIAVVVTPGAVINSLALFNVRGRDAVVELTDPVDGIVYQKTVQLIDAGVTNWYDWFFSPIPRQTDFVLLDIQAYGTAALSVTVNNADASAAVGNFVIGRQSTIGAAVYGTSVGIIDYSRKTTDAFGNTTILQRAFSKRAEYDVAVETSQVGLVQRLLASVRSSPVVWIGEKDSEATIVFGYYRDFSINISTPSVSDATITVEGLI